VPASIARGRAVLPVLRRPATGAAGAEHRHAPATANAKPLIEVGFSGFSQGALPTVSLPTPLPLSTTHAIVFSTKVGARSYEGLATQLPGEPPDGAVTPGADIVVVLAPTSDVDQTLHQLLLVEGLVSAIVLLTVGGLSWWLVRRGLRPLADMATTAGAIAGGDLTQRVETPDPAPRWDSSDWR